VPVFLPGDSADIIGSSCSRHDVLSITAGTTVVVSSIIIIHHHYHGHDYGCLDQEQVKEVRIFIWQSSHHMPLGPRFGPRGRARISRDLRQPKTLTFANKELRRTGLGRRDPGPIRPHSRDNLRLNCGVCQSRLWDSVPIPAISTKWRAGNCSNAKVGYSVVCVFNYIIHLWQTNTTQP